MRHYINYKFEKATDISDAIVEDILGAWKPSSDILFSRDEALSIIRNLISVERSEFAMKNICVLTSNDSVMGVTLSLEMSKVQAARQANIFGILSDIDNKKEFMTKLSRYNQCFQSLPKENGVYLSKFSVAEPFRRQGIGRILMEHFLDHYNSKRPIFLEVHKSNAVAIRLYEQYGFKKVIDPKGSEYDLMKRTQPTH